MRLAAIAALFAAFTAQSVTGWKIPEGTPDGVYSVDILPNGTEVHARIGDLTRTSFTGPRHRSRRQTIVHLDTTTTPNELDSPLPPDDQWSIDCYPDYFHDELDHDDCDAANDAIDYQCSNGAEVHPNRSFYSISNCVVAYFCHFKSRNTKEDAVCTRGERGQTSLLITHKCGRYQAGSASRTVVIPPNDAVGPSRSYRVAYGYEDYCPVSGVDDFCGMAPTDT